MSEAAYVSSQDAMLFACHLVPQQNRTAYSSTSYQILARKNTKQRIFNSWPQSPKHLNGYNGDLNMGEFDTLVNPTVRANDT